MRAQRERELAEAIGTLGVWDAGLCLAPTKDATEAARELEAMGYEAAWLHEGGHDAFVLASLLLGATQRFAVGTSIVSIFRHEPAQMANAARSLGEAYPGRFVLGIGSSHEGARSWHGREYERPYTDMSEYLDAVDRSRWYGPRPDPPVPRMIAALGPRMLDLARRRSRGAIPYLVPVAHTAYARERLGPDPVLAVHQAIVLRQSRERSIEFAREHVSRYLERPNYRNNLMRSGLSEDDLAGGGSDRCLEAVIAWGDADEVAARVRAHLDVGADHVCVSPLGRALGEISLDGLPELAESVHAVA